MTVFVDDWRQQARVGPVQARWSQHAFAASIGLRRSWFRDKPWPYAHYDVTEPKRQQAITAGATEIPSREAGHKALDAMRERRDRDGRPAARILAMGSRKWSDPATIRTALADVVERHPGERLVLVHGKCDPRHASSGRRIRWGVAEHLSSADQMNLHGADWLADPIAREMAGRSSSTRPTGTHTAAPMGATRRG